MRRLAAVLAVLWFGCGRTSVVGEPDGGDEVWADAGSDAGPPTSDAGLPDAGLPDAGRPDAGPSDSGTPDEGTQDAGSPDGGTSPFGPGFDAGACLPLARPPPAGVAASPRADPFLELLVLHGAPSVFFVDDATYARAAREKAFIEGNDAGPLRFIPDWGEYLVLTLDAVGSAQLRARTYTEWDCLNWAWRATPQLYPWTPTPDGYVAVRVQPIVSLPQLEQDYEALSHVVEAGQSGYAICAGCGCSADACLWLDGGSWSWLWYTEERQCEREWHRLRSQDDGGLQLETWRDGGLPLPWFDETPECWDQLWTTQHRPRDAGP